MRLNYVFQLVTFVLFTHVENISHATICLLILLYVDFVESYHIKIFNLRILNYGTFKITYSCFESFFLKNPDQTQEYKCIILLTV